MLYVSVKIYADGHGHATSEPTPEPSNTPVAEPEASTTRRGDHMCWDYNDCMCNECNHCTCAGGMWACTRMGCPTESRWVDDGHHGHEEACIWTQTKEWDMHGQAHCNCDCVFPPSAASGLKQAGGLFLVGMAVLGIVLRQ